MLGLQSLLSCPCFRRSHGSWSRLHWKPLRTKPLQFLLLFPVVAVSSAAEPKLASLDIARSPGKCCDEVDGESVTDQKTLHSARKV